MNYFKEFGVAAVHLDEVQDSGRYKTKDSIDAFLKIFWNMMQHKEWPICLIMTATPEARQLINDDRTLQRRLKPMEMRPMNFVEDGQVLRKTLGHLFDDAGLADPGILSIDEFIKILIHASAGRFGVAVEMSIEAIGECLGEGSDEIDMGHFADAYEMRMDCDEELNPFVSENWKLIDTLTALQRYEEERQVKRRQFSARFAAWRGHLLIVGKGRDVADRMREWIVEGAAEGFNVMPPLFPSGLQSFALQVMPHLSS